MIAVAMLPAVPALATEPGWTADNATGCKVWNNRPRPNETVSYSGPCLNGMASGKGVAQWIENGKPTDRAEVSFKNGKMEGTGTYSWPNGQTYSGTFKNNYLHGKGTYNWPDGTVYSGELTQGEFNGHGTMTQANGGSYSGAFVMGKKTGFAEVRMRRGDPAIRGFLSNSWGTWDGDFLVVRGMLTNNNMERQCPSEKACLAEIAAEQDRQLAAERARDRCEHLYVGKVVQAPTQSFFSTKTRAHEAIVMGFSTSQRVATVRSTSNANMIGELPCSALK